MSDEHSGDRYSGFVWGFLFNLIGMLGIVIFAEGDARKFMLRGAFVGLVAQLIVIPALIIFISTAGSSGLGSSGSGSTDYDFPAGNVDIKCSRTQEAQGAPIEDAWNSCRTPYRY